MMQSELVHLVQEWAQVELYFLAQLQQMMGVEVEMVMEVGKLQQE